jgi:surface polysaccharide O-acyltransferase-like enzyme
MVQQAKVSNIPVDLIRTLAITGVILLHATNDFSPNRMDQLEVVRWLTVDVYQCIARIGVPLFVMLTGALLLQPSKNDESIGGFLKKRWIRIGPPLIFWGALYFVWTYFADHQAVTVNTVIQGYLSLPYLQFWYLYMLAGLYLITPFLRILLAHADDKLLKYFFVLWVIGASVIPVISFFTIYNISSYVVLVTGWVGYYILGIYLLKVKIPRSYLVLFTALGITLAAIGTYFMSYNYGGGNSYYFQEYLSPTMILASVMAYLLLNTVKMPSFKTAQDQALTPNGENAKNNQPSKLRKLMHVISENTMPIFLLHLMVLYSIQRGYFGFVIDGSLINSIIGVPIVTALTLFICLAIILPLKKIPYLKNLIG